MIVLLQTLPIWLKLHMSLWFLVLLIFHLLYDGGILVMLLSVFEVKMKKDVKVRTVIMAWVFGVVIDFVVIILLLILANGIEAYDLKYPMNSAVGVIVLLLMMIFSIVMLYFVIKYLMKRVAIFGARSKKIAFWMAVLTAPYYILLPINVSFDSFL